MHGGEGEALSNRREGEGGGVAASNRFKPLWFMMYGNSLQHKTSGRCGAVAMQGTEYLVTAMGGEKTHERTVNKARKQIRPLAWPRQASSGSLPLIPAPSST